MIDVATCLFIHAWSRRTPTNMRHNLHTLNTVTTLSELGIYLLKDFCNTQPEHVLEVIWTHPCISEVRGFHMCRVDQSHTPKGLCGERGISCIKPESGTHTAFVCNEGLVPKTDFVFFQHIE